MIKTLIAATLSLVFLTGILANEPAPNAAKPAAEKAPKYSRAVGEMIAGVSEIGSILDEKHVIYAAETLKSNVLEAVIAAIDPEGGAILTMQEATRRQNEANGLFYGIGCKFRVEDQWPEIVEVISNSAAAAAGLSATNLIVKIDGHSTEGMTIDQVVRLLRGGQGETLELAIRADRKTAKSRDVRLTRSAIQVPVTGTTETWPQEIGYLKVNGLYTNSGAVIVEQLRAWQNTNCFGIILDLRGANGMNLESAAEIGGLFARAGTALFFLRDGRNVAMTAYQAENGQPVDKPIIVLINRDTSAAAEVLAGLFRTCKGAMLIGAPTRGDDRVREVIPLANDFALYIGTKRIELDKGPAYYQKGIIPHVRVTQTNTPAVNQAEFPDEETDIFAGISEEERMDQALIKRIGNDMILRRAVDILLGLKALDFKVR